MLDKDLSSPLNPRVARDNERGIVLRRGQGPRELDAATSYALEMDGKVIPFRARGQWGEQKIGDGVQTEVVTYTIASTGSGIVWTKTGLKVVVYDYESDAELAAVKRIIPEAMQCYGQGDPVADGRPVEVTTVFASDLPRDQTTH